MPSYFHQLHQQVFPLLLANIWDPASAVLAQQQGAKALGTSSAALAWSLGYADGQQLPVAELLAAVRRILRVTQLPVTVDIEQGYSEQPAQVAELVLQLAELGVSGINIEDGLSEPVLLCDKIRACRTLLAGLPLYINARTDVYLAQLASGSEAIAECTRRLALYAAAGADGVFVPCLTDLAVAKQLSQHCNLPLNLMGWPEGASLQDLTEAGVQRLSAGPALFVQSYQAFQQAVFSFLHPGLPADQPVQYANFNTLFS
ncbi:isocitrate lyase/phosphoenolpyruvate mutase family protein [Rheinheimera soli]|uniref:2-methylisocitrate lyase-like PEP mutase family enzyme n=1 Tax=Rheinheimera soli TaxID=443616 RepID=A0ABU1VWN6_9GAMM|nr:isocitrate lyase/phosphoenolpyruvate mutase family protein [Rheinheimera soli]MDR7120129.1 2-methylisocitrate lyase-like PEP mutase family enzyme [Rheinheimera soli]